MKLLRLAAAIGTAALLLLDAGSARAQFGPPPMTAPGQGAAPKKDPNQPETHAASGSGDETIPKPTTSEPTLPQNPNTNAKYHVGSIASHPS